MFFNYFRHDKSEPRFTDDCSFTLFFNFIPNRFRLNMEPHELVWKSVTANLRGNCVSLFKFCFKKSDIHGAIISDLSGSRPSYGQQLINTRLAFWELLHSVSPSEKCRPNYFWCGSVISSYGPCGPFGCDSLFKTHVKTPETSKF